MTFHGFTALVLLFAFYGGMFALVEANERAYVSELAPKSVRGTALGTFFTLQSLAALPAGAVAGLLYDAHPFWTFGYGCGFSVAAVLLLVWHHRCRDA
jgi:MFS family permease